MVVDVGDGQWKANVQMIGESKKQNQSKKH